MSGRGSGLVARAALPAVAGLAALVAARTAWTPATAEPVRTHASASAFAPSRGIAALPPPPESLEGAIGAADALAPAATLDLVTLPGWSAHADVASGRAQRLFGPPLAVDPGDEVAFARAFLESHRALVGLPSGATLDARPAVHSGRFVFVIFDERFRGVPVEGAHADLRFVDGRMTMARFTLARGLDVARMPPPTPAVSRAKAEEAAARALAAAGRRASSAAAVDAQTPLVWLHRGDAWHLARRVRVDADAPRGRLTLFVDARDATVLAARDAIRDAAPATVEVRGEYEPRRVGDTPVTGGFGFSEIDADGQALFADTNGEAVVPNPATPDSAVVRFRGLYTEEVLFGTSALTTATVPLVAGSAASFSWSDANSTLAERDLYHSRLVVHARHKAMAPDVAWVDLPLRYELEVVDAQGCNAFWDGVLDQVNLYRESNACNDTARVADVVYHETTHGLHQNLSAGGFIAGDVGEGSADYVAASINGDPEIGPSFFKSTTAGIRNLGPDLVYPDDATGEPHNDGVIWGGAWWDLRTSMIAVLGSSAGVAATDTMLADTLRADPTLTDGFWDALAADDDDGDLSNGTPHECAVVHAFAQHGLGPGDRLQVFHVPLGAQVPGAGAYSVRVHAAPFFPACDPQGFAGGTLEWRLAGGQGAWTVVPLVDDLVPGWHRAEIPSQAEGAAVEYRLRALDGSGRESTAPSANFDSEPFSFPVSGARRIFFDDFETDRGWTHRQIDGPVYPGSDDWERGTPRGRSGDPTGAFSGTNVWGNDLGGPGTNGAYVNAIENRLTSPTIDCRHAAGVHLRFRRWLNVESGASDQASVLVNGHVVWTNPADEDVLDAAWREEDIDVSPWADGRDVHVAFDLKSDLAITKGGWTIDDVELTATGTREPAGTGCDVGGTRRDAWGVLAAIGALVLTAGALRRREARG